jgi:predicted esterase
MDKVFAEEKIPAHCNLIVLGFSQGVSIAARWTAKSKVKLNELILYAGGIPEELTPDDFEFLRSGDAKIKLVLGNKDEFITDTRLQKEKEKMKYLFGEKGQLIAFEGGHEIKKDLLIKLVE